MCLLYKKIILQGTPDNCFPQQKTIVTAVSLCSENSIMLILTNLTDTLVALASREFSTNSLTALWIEVITCEQESSCTVSPHNSWIMLYLTFPTSAGNGKGFYFALTSCGGGKICFFDWKNELTVETKEKSTHRADQTWGLKPLHW